MSLEPLSVTWKDEVFCEAHWYARDGAPIPPGLPRIIPVDANTRLPFSQPVICLSPVETQALPEQLAQIRAAIGDEAHLIAVFADPPASETIADALDAGADDILTPADAGGMQVACARARRAMTARRRAHAFRQRYVIERDYLQACIDSLPAPIFFKNINGIYVGCNRAFEDYIGHSAEKIIGSSVYDVSPPELAAIYEAADSKLMREGGVQVYEASVTFADGGLREVSFHKAVIRDGDGEVRGLAGAMVDITARKQLEERLQNAADRDPLTDLYNRRKFMEEAEQVVSEARDPGRPVAFAVIDLDHFKSVNDRHGHAAGDQALREVARVLEDCIGQTGLVARAGGEEFFAVLPGFDIKSASALLELLRHRVALMEIKAGERSFNVTISIGIAGLAFGREDIWGCIKRADDALYRAKHDGRNRLSQAA